MAAGSLTIRMAAPSDAKELLDIYRPYVEQTAITFEYETPSLEAFAERIEHTLQTYPYLAAEAEGRIVGYAYAGPFQVRPAYGWAVETTVYVDRNHTGTGCGRALYQQLESLLVRQQVQNLYACIACTQQEDEYLTNQSREFHRHMGYRLAGTFSQCGYKFGRWYDMVWMEKMIGGHPDHPEPLIPIGRLEESNP